MTDGIPTLGGDVLDEDDPDFPAENEEDDGGNIALGLLLPSLGGHTWGSLLDP